MNIEDKIYPPTSSKVKTLREKGIIPFSYSAKYILNFNYAIISIFLFFPNNLETLFPLNIDNNLETMTFAVGLMKTWFIIFIKIALTFSVISFCTSLLLSEFLFLPFKKYTEGNYKKSQKINLRAAALLMVTTYSITIAFLILLFQNLKSKISSSQNGLTNSNYLNTTLESFSSFDTIKVFLIAVNLFFILSAIVLTFLEKIDFHNRNRMSKADILLEVKENEGSNVTKQLIRSEF